MSDTRGRGLLRVQLEIDPDYDDEFNRWYTEEHFSAMVSFSGTSPDGGFLSLIT